uniref:Palmdelphin n=1 Tax=Electrophorus electricus TaxID=8005 RepID=A0A4W4GS16_ELEEL
MNYKWMINETSLSLPVNLCIVSLSHTALFAMEINVQKDLRTGQSHVLSFSTVSPQELQQRGIKVYDDGRKSVFALRSDASQRSGNGVAELSAREVEDLLNMPHIHHASHHTSGCPEPFVVDKTTWPELRRDRGVQYPGQELHGPPSILNTLPSDEPVTMIFMGYQPTDNDHQSSKGSIRAELVVIGEGEEDPSPCAASYHHSSVGLHQNRNTNNTTPRQDSEGALSNPPATGSKKTSKVKRRCCCMLM